MTRLTSGDIDTLSDHLSDFDERLRRQTGWDMLGIACHGTGIRQKDIQAVINDLSIAVVTITAGLGTITGFAQTIKDILTHIGFSAFIPEPTDAAGIARAVEDKADILFMADDNRYFALNLKQSRLIDNIQATGNVFAAALDLMAKGVRGKRVLVLGAGPVGMAATQTLLGFGADVGIHDRDMVKCRKNCADIQKKQARKIELVHDLSSVKENFSLFIEATSAQDVITSTMIGPETFIAAPGVPLGITANGLKKAGIRILYDPLQLGTAAMAVRAAILRQ